jgi:hypothetical protein
MTFFLAPSQVFPELMRSPTDPSSNRRGLTDIEFNKVLERGDSTLFVKRRTRFLRELDQLEDEEDITENSTWMFGCLRWRDPDCAADLSELLAKLSGGSHAGVFDEEIQKKIVAVVRSTRQEWLRVLSALRDMKRDNLRSRDASMSSLGHRPTKRRRLSAGLGTPQDSLYFESEGAPLGPLQTRTGLETAHLPPQRDVFAVLRSGTDGSHCGSNAHISNHEHAVEAAAPPAWAKMDWAALGNCRQNLRGRPLLQSPMQEHSLLSHLQPRGYDMGHGNLLATRAAAALPSTSALHPFVTKLDNHNPAWPAFFQQAGTVPSLDLGTLQSLLRLDAITLQTLLSLDAGALRPLHGLQSADVGNTLQSLLSADHQRVSAQNAARLLLAAQLGGSLQGLAAAAQQQPSSKCARFLGTALQDSWSTAAQQ